MAAELSKPIIGLIACSKQKLDHRAPARELYCSPLFQKSLRFLECSAMEIAVISAKYGLRFIDDELDPYDLTLNDMSRAERDEWALGVRNEIGEHWSHRDVKFWFCGGKEYARPLRGLHGRDVLHGLQIGERLSWLNHEIAAAEPGAIHGHHVWVPEWKGHPDAQLGSVQGPTLEIATQMFWDPRFFPMATMPTRERPRKKDITWRKVKTWTDPIAVRRQRYLEERGLVPQKTP